MIRFLAALLLLCSQFVTAAQAPGYITLARVDPGYVSIAQVSASEFTVRLPVKNAVSKQVVVDYRFSKHPTTNVWWISNYTAKDLRGGVSDIVLGEPDSVAGYAMQIGSDDYPGAKATGQWNFSGQPSADETITVNGTVFTFKASGATGNQINIGGSATETIDNCVTVLNASVVAGVALATYSNVGGTALKAEYDAAGTAGNAFTLAEAATNVTVSGATMSGGTVNYDFFGEGHGNEARLTLSVKIDGVEVGLASGGGQRIVVAQTVNILKPAGTGAGGAIGTGTLEHEITAAGVRVSHTHTITTSGLSYRTAYGGMMPVSNTAFNRSQAGDGAAVAILTNNTVTETGKTASYYQAFHTDQSVNPYRLKVTLTLAGLPEASTAWSAVTAPKAWFFSRAAYGKWYLNWVGDTLTAITAPFTSTHQQFYEVIDDRGSFFDPKRYIPANDERYTMAA